MNTVIIPVFNKSWLTKRCLLSLLKNSSHHTKNLVIINNASTDDTVKLLEDFKEKFTNHHWIVKIIHNEKNIGFGRAMNLGFSHANTQYVTLLNNDTWLPENWDEILRKRTTELNADMISPHHYERPWGEGEFNETQMIEISKKYSLKNKGKLRKDFSAICMFWNAEQFKKIGKFDERYFVTYEDTDLKERMIREKYKFFQTADCVIWHYSKGSRSALLSDYERESKKLFLEKWNFDPSLRDAKFYNKMRRTFRKFKEKFELF